MGHGPARTDEVFHDLLSPTHDDTTPAAPVVGDVIVAQQDTTGTTDDSVYWLDGKVLAAIAGVNDPGGVKFWVNGLPMDVIVSGTILGPVTWRRLPRGTEGQALIIQDAIPQWRDVAGLSTGDSVKAYRTSALSCPFNSLLEVTLDAVEWDDGGYWAVGAPTGFTVTSAGVYIVVGQIRWGNTQFGLGYEYVYVDGVQKAAALGGISNVDPSYGDTEPHQVTAILKLTAGQFVQFRVRAVRLSGADATTDPGANDIYFSMVKVG